MNRNIAILLSLAILISGCRIFGLNKPPKYTFEQIEDLTQAEARKTIMHDGCMLIAYLDWCEGCYSKPDKRHRRFEDPFSITFLKFDGKVLAKGFVDNYGHHRDEIMNDTSILNYTREHFNEIESDTLKPDTTFDAKGQIRSISTLAIYSSDGPIRRISIYKRSDSLTYEYMLPVDERLSKGYRYKYFQMLQKFLADSRK